MAHDVLKQQGFELVSHRTDHKTLKDLISAIKKRGLRCEIMPPCNHRQNPAKQAIQVFKAHFISALNGVNGNFPPEAWDLLTPQTNMTMNVLRECDIDEAHLSHSCIHGAFDFKSHPLAPLGCKAAVHQRSTANGGARGSWENRGKLGCCIGPAMNSH